MAKPKDNRQRDPRAREYQPSLTTQEKLTEYAMSAISYAQTELGFFYDRMDNVDLAYQRESKLFKDQENRNAQKANKLGKHEMPLLLSLLESANTYFIGTFLSGFPIFEIVADRAKADAAIALSSKIAKDQVSFGWVTEWIKFFHEGMKYNLCAIELDYKDQAQYAVQQTVALTEGQKRVDVTYRGNCFKFIPLRNAFWDPRVPPHKLNQEAEFSGYIERINKIEAKRRVNALGETALVNRLTTAFESARKYDFYKEVDIRSDSVARGSTTQDFSRFFDTANTGNRKINYQYSYDWIVMYSWIIPSEADMTWHPEPNTPQLFKLIFLNNTLIYMRRMIHAHNQSPLLFGHPDVDSAGYDSKSFAESLIPFQHSNSTLGNMRINSLRRALSDRALYNPNLIDPAALSSDNPAHKIAVKGALPNQDLTHAYYAIPFRDDAANSIYTEMQQLQSTAEQAVGVNRAMQGNFVKGNKTLNEFQTVVQNAEARLQAKSIFWEEQVMRLAKRMLLLNYLQFAGAEEIFNPSIKQSLRLDITTLNETSLGFNVSDGLLPSSKLLNTEEMLGLFNFLGVAPQLQQEINVPELVMYILKERGFKSINDFKYTAQEKAQNQQQAIAALKAKTQAETTQQQQPNTQAGGNMQ